jgi:YhfZ-like protein/helix-turn-helix protein
MTVDTLLSEPVRLESLLARQLLDIKEGESLPRVRELAEANQVSVGSISQALADLERVGAVRIANHGHLGSQVEERSIGKLWKVATHEALIISLTLPSNPLYEGLATALKKLLSGAGIQVYLMFVRGSRERMIALRERRCHVAVMSRIAADDLHGDAEEIAFSLPPKSLVTNHMVYYANTRRSKRPLRLAIDWSSYDVEALTKLEFGNRKIEYKPVSFMQIDWMLRERHVDVAIWTSDDMNRRRPGDKVRSRPLSAKVRAIVGQRDSSAAFVIRKGDDAVRAVLEATCVEERILEIQRGVVKGEIVPEY